MNLLVWIPESSRAFTENQKGGTGSVTFKCHMWRNGSEKKKTTIVKLNVIILIIFIAISKH